MIKKSLLLTLLMALLVPWAAQAQETLTVHAGTETSRFVPFYGYYADDAQTNQMIYPATELADMAGGEISAMMLYWTNGNYSGGSGVGTWTISIGETSATTLSGLDNTTSLTQVFTGGLDALFNSNNTLPITFDNAYTYNGGNLLVQFSHSASSYKDYAFYGETVTGASYCYNSQRNFLPKTTFTYEAAAGDCPKPNNFVASNVTAHTADLSWESDGFEFVLEYKKASDSNWTQKWPDVNSYTLTGLAAETEYQARVAAFHETCPTDPETGDHVQSDWREISFTTGIACFAPTNLAVTPESITASEATVTWEGTSDSYVVMIGEENFAVSADFETGDLSQADFTTTSSYPWTVVANTHSGAYCAKSGNGGQHATTSDMVLNVTQSTDMTLTFSAKVSSESGWDKAYFSIDGVDKIDAISGNGDWIDYSYPLTAGTHTLRWYYSKDGSGEDNDDCFYVDDIVISAAPASWTDYNTNAKTYTFTNLTANRHYQVKVTGYCGDEGYSQASAPVSFTTLESCPAPTGLTVSDVTANEATISWTSDAEAWQICVNDDEENLIDVTETTYTLTGLYAQTTYTVKVRTNCGDDDYSDWTNNVSFTTLEACPAPTGFAVAENGLTGHTATLNWQGTSNEYQVSYRTAAYMDGIEEGFSSNPAGWSFKQGALNADGTATLSGTTSWTRSTNNGVFDTHIYMNMYSTKNYWLITPSMEIQNGDALSFDMAYTAYSGTQAAPTLNSPTHRFAVLISTDDMQHWTILREWNNSGSEYVLDAIPTSGQNSGNIDLSAYAGQTAYIAFFGHSETSSYDNNFHFDNVAIGTPVPAGEMQYATNITEETVTLQGLLAETEYEAWLQGDCGSEGPSTEVGPITFTTDVACPAPANVQVTNISAYAATLSWTGSSESYNVEYRPAEIAKASEWEIVTTEEKTIALANLISETLYEFRIQGNCGDEGNSEYTYGSFTTAEACPVPTNLHTTNVGSTSADLAWTGSIDVESFTVRYRAPEHLVGGLSETFDVYNTLPAGWMRYSGLVDAVVAGTATLSSISSGWSFSNTNVFGQYHAKVNIYGTYCKYWLVTPEVTPSNGTFTFDLALTDYNNADPIEDPTAQADDRFVVLVYANDAWTILREWNNSGSAYVYNTIATEGEAVSIDLSAYVGQTVKIAFYGESTEDGGDNDLHIDNVVIGNPQVIPATDWQTVTTSDMNVTLTGLTPETPYEAQVKSDCSDPEEWSTAISFTTMDRIVWDNPEDWTVPEEYADVTIPANTEVIIPSGFTAYADEITIEEGGQIIMEPGAQLYHSNEIPVALQMNVEGYDRDNGGYVLIAAPAYTNDIDFSIPVDNTNLNTGAFDLYAFDQNYQGAEWRNYKAGEFDALTLGQGYLYANSEDINIVFDGQTTPTNADYSIDLVYSTDSVTFRGWNLVGNPFTCMAYVDRPFYTMSTEGDAIVEVNIDQHSVEVMQGIFVVAESEDDNMIFTTTEPQPSAKLTLNLSQGRGIIDRAIVRFDEGRLLPKFQLNPSLTKVYFPMDGKDYAVVSAEEMGEMPVSFKAETDGTYNLSFTTEEVSFNYLHLIDNMTGADVDLLATPSYTFEARSTDFANRFKLVFAMGTLSVSENFAFFNNGNLLINNEGEATVQVIDINGRILSSETINGSANINVNGAAGVYMIRLINGENVRVQKVVVR